MIITDHHNLGARLPPAVAVINPKRPDSKYPETRLAGVGIAYKVAQALRNELSERANFDQEQLLDLVALGTVADLTPLLGENRVLVAGGLKVLNDFQRPGIKALAKVASLKEGAMTTESISFGLAPRINAAGRLSHAYSAARLLSANNSRTAEEQAWILNDINRERQRLTKQLGERAEEMVEAGGTLLFAADSQFISGIVGLIASRLSEQHYRPAIVVERGETESRGSCRSIPEFHITEALDELEELLVRHGGHAMAAGFTVDNANLLEFESRITGIAEDQLASQDLTPTLNIDTEVKIGDVDWALHGELEKFEPTGAENRRPILMSRGVHVYSHRAVGVDGAHLQLYVGDSRTKLSCIAFRQGAWAGRLPDHIDLVYTLNANDWKNRRQLQLVVQDIRPAENSGS
jgi:single-stranded-DNA-specific exonuclease